jgi:polysaccharide export outer membrane protein
MLTVRNFSAILTLIALSGCAMAPGMHFDESSYEKQPQTTAAESAEPGQTEQQFLVTPITPQLLTKLNAQHAQPEPAAAPDVQQAISNYSYRVGPQDVLTVTVWDHPELTIPAGEFRDPEASGTLVNRDGTIFYPYVGVVEVAGKTVTEIRALLTQRIAKYITNPQLDVKVAAFRSQKVHVVGEVVKPSVLPVTNVPLTALEAVNQAGGNTPESDLHHVTLTRGDQVRTLDLQRLYDVGDLSQNVVLQDGDVLHVPDRNNNKVYVLGEVQKPASYLMHKGRMSLAEAIGGSEGLDKLTSDPSRIYVIREEHQKPAIYRLDAQSPDALLLATRFDLKPQDVVYVSTTNVARWNRVMTQILPTIQGLWQTKVLTQ